jgi:spermidine/putrescine transport system substrate-binding protein
MLGGAGDAWWCAAIYAGVDFKNIGTQENLDKVAALLRKQRPLVRTYASDTTTMNQALASGEIVAAMTWNDSAVSLRGEGIPVKFAKPKEGALTWVGGVMIHRDAPHLDKAHDIVDSMLSYERGLYEISEGGYGHSNAKALASFTEEELADLGLSLDVAAVLGAGHFMTPQTQAFDTDSNTLYEEIKAGF